MEQRDIDTIIRLSKEGKQISKIWEEDYPTVDYWDIYGIIYNAGERSALGVKRTITNRIGELRGMIEGTSTYSLDEFEEIIDEIDDLVCFLYDRHKENQRKLDDIRKIINK